MLGLTHGLVLLECLQDGLLTLVGDQLGPAPAGEVICNSEAIVHTTRRGRGREWVTVLLASCTGRAVVRGTIHGVNGEAFHMLYRTLNCIQCPVIEALMPELECEWCNSSGVGSPVHGAQVGCDPGAGQCACLRLWPGRVPGHLR
jgi:hypothetical protein